MKISKPQQIVANKLKARKYHSYILAFNHISEGTARHGNEGGENI